MFRSRVWSVSDAVDVESDWLFDKTLPPIEAKQSVTRTFWNVASFIVVADFFDVSQTFLQDSILRLRSTLGEISPPASCFLVLAITLAHVVLESSLIGLTTTPRFVCWLFTTWLYFWAPGLVVAFAGRSIGLVLRGCSCCCFNSALFVGEALDEDEADVVVAVKFKFPSFLLANELRLSGLLP